MNPTLAGFADSAEILGTQIFGARSQHVTTTCSHLAGDSLTSQPSHKNPRPLFKYPTPLQRHEYYGVVGRYIHNYI